MAVPTPRGAAACLLTCGLLVSLHLTACARRAQEGHAVRNPGAPASGRGRVPGPGGRARTGRLRQDDLEGGVLTVTNLGMYDVERTHPGLNRPRPRAP
ncbi:2-oxo acid dehydrogenase subunit E2 [Nonomuraea basaltis]|uniref:2-oxo acid dehydrogenase subunit E2 n=1 Tax=Nonomuraea basaltis TaxID=2495887 RepID=UPI00110C46E2|nr:2-oxo acid dehydrogenase subunit E2 [Nonomuraea basaltis]